MTADRTSSETPADFQDIRLNIGCGGNPLPGYVNVDMDTIETIRARYPNKHFADDIIVRQLDVFNLPYPDGSIQEIRTDSFIEHLDFFDEPKFFYEARRVLAPGGKLYLSTPDFEAVCKAWLAAEDDWKDFFRNDDEAIRQEHWFGTYETSLRNRWGYLITTIFGNQNGQGMYHQNAYTEGKLRAIGEKLGLDVTECERYLWKGDRDPMIRVVMVRRDD